MKATTRSNQKKEALRLSLDDYQQRLEDEVEFSVGEIKRITGVTIAVGGAMLLGYLLVRALREDKNTSESDVSTIGKKGDFWDKLVRAGVEIASEYALTFARKRLVDYIDQLNKMKKLSNESTERTTEEEGAGN